MCVYVQKLRDGGSHGRGFCGGIADPLSGGSLQMESSKAEKRGLGLSENGSISRIRRKRPEFFCIQCIFVMKNI